LGNRLGPEIIKNVEQPSKGFSGAGWKACAANKISNASKRISSLQKPNRRLLRENGAVKMGTDTIFLFFP
jgi:hypothetical protein